MLTMQIMIQYHMQLHIQLSQDLVQATDPVVLYVLIWSQVSANEERMEYLHYFIVFLHYVNTRLQQLMAYKPCDCSSLCRL